MTDMARFTPPSGREHPPKGAGGKVGGAHSGGQLVKARGARPTTKTRPVPPTNKRG